MKNEHPLYPFYPVRYNDEYREKVAKNLDAEAAWWRAGACDTCITGLDSEVPGAGCMYMRGWDVTSWYNRGGKQLLEEKTPRCISGQHTLTGCPISDCTCVTEP
jgi:hypothetical protein